MQIIQILNAPFKFSRGDWTRMYVDQMLVKEMFT